ncbi:MAG TPA: hypothetical protein VKY74_00560 [Chloroflexia bacterium]|nr:hypothetical protein [Chloroflexia bacterium]
MAAGRGNCLGPAPFAPWQEEIWVQGPQRQRITIRDGLTAVTDGTTRWQYDPLYRHTEITRQAAIDPSAILYRPPALGELLSLVDWPEFAVTVTSTVTVAGRAAYLLDWTLLPGRSYPTLLRHLTILLDQQTYLHVGTRLDMATEKGFFQNEWAYTSLTIHPVLDPALFRFAPLTPDRGAPRPPPADPAAGLDRYWQALVPQLPYRLFRPATLPAWLIPTTGPCRDLYGLVQAYRSPASPAALVIAENRAPIHGLRDDSGANVQIGPFPGRYWEQDGYRSLTLVWDNTQISLTGHADVTRAELFRIVAALHWLSGPPRAPEPRPPSLTSPAGPPTLRDLTFLDRRQGWALLATCAAAEPCPVRVMATTDGGQTWQTRSALEASNPESRDPPGPGMVSHLRFANARDGWAFGPGLFTTHDGGRSWADDSGYGAIVALAPQPGSVWAVEVTCSPTFTMISSCPLALLASTDNGTTWQPTAGPFLLAGDVQLMRSTPTMAWLNARGAPLDWPPSGLIATADAGQRWQPRSGPCGSPGTVIERVAAHAPGYVWLLCDRPPEVGSAATRLYGSADTGAHWRLLAAGGSGGALPQGAVRDLVFSTPATGWVSLDSGLLYRTTDGGAHWTPVPGLGFNPSLPALESIHFADPSHGWFATAQHIFRTTDGGAHWTDLGRP